MSTLFVIFVAILVIGRSGAGSEAVLIGVWLSLGVVSVKDQLLGGGVVAGGVILKEGK